MILSTGSKTVVHRWPFVFHVTSGERRKTNDERRGFTLIEVLVTLAVLSVGIVAIYRTYFLTLDTLSHVNSRLTAINLLNERVVALERSLKERGEIPFGSAEDVATATIHNRPVDFHFDTAIRNVEDLQNFYDVTLVLWWVENARTIHLSRSFYVTN